MANNYIDFEIFGYTNWYENFHWRTTNLVIKTYEHIQAIMSSNHNIEYFP
jgi:hypothetical protein